MSDANDKNLLLEEAAAQARLGLWEFDPTGGQFRGSKVVGEILGLNVDLGTNLEAVCRLYASESPRAFERALHLSLKDGKPFSLISEIQTSLGERRWVRTQGQAQGDADSPARKVFGTLQDISDIRLLDRIAQESALTLNQVEEITHIGHWSVSLVDGSIYHSDEIKRIFGYEPAEYALSVEDALNAYHPDDRGEVVRLFQRAAETGEGYEFDLRLIQPSGETRHVHSKGYTERDADSKIIRVYGIFQDITEQVRAEIALRESEAALKALIDGVHTAIVVHGKDGKILLSNQMANHILAPLTKEVVGKSLSDPAWHFICEDGRVARLDELPVTRILRTGQPVTNLVLGRAAVNGVAWLLVNGVPVLDKNGVLSRIIVSFVDITERKEIEERLHQAEKMKAAGQLAGGVAHDFNNQLMVMLSFAELLKESVPEGSPECNWISGILAGVQRSSELTKQLLAFAHKGKYVVTIVDLDALISEVVSMATHSFDKKIRISHDKGPLPATISGDLSQLHNALLNMALNSRDSMPRGGELGFTTEHVMLDEATISRRGFDFEPGEYVRVTIRDTGTGMDPATRSHIFEPFFTTKGQGKGTGMGMASVYGTVKNHHGAIEVESDPGEGTTITLYFPFKDGEPSKPENPEVQPAKSGARILIIDDDAGITTSMATLLRRKGYDPVTCSSGREGIAEFKNSWQLTEVVLLDMIMPEMNGAETFVALKEIDPQVKVILISGYSFTEETMRVREHGAVGFLEKPVPAKALLKTVSEAIHIKSEL